MRRILIVALLCMFSLEQASGEEGFESLFNGKDLTGWSGDPKLWSVEDGCITGKTSADAPLPYNKFLILDRAPDSDFEFRCEFRLEGKNNSGVQYRSRQDKTKDFVVVGYQADIHANPPFTGMLYDEKGRGILAKRGDKVVISAKAKKMTESLGIDVKPVDLTEWHELKIIARGPRVIHQLDGETIVDITDNDPQHSDASGIFALQVHRGPAMKVQFRKLALKQLAQ